MQLNRHIQQERKEEAKDVEFKLVGPPTNQNPSNLLYLTFLVHYQPTQQYYDGKCCLKIACEEEDWGKLKYKQKFMNILSYPPLYICTFVYKYDILITIPLWLLSLLFISIINCILFVVCMYKMFVCFFLIFVFFCLGNI